MHIALIANGAIRDYTEIKKKLKRCKEVFAVDGGLLHCFAMNITPSLIIGDFDSCPSYLLTHFPHSIRKQYPTDKDLSDLELAVQEALDHGATHITVFGGVLGDRTDHSLSNLLLLSRYPDTLSIENEKEILLIITTSATFSLKKNQTLSLIPLNGPIESVSTRGLRWELTQQKLDKTFISLSNVTTTDSVEIYVNKRNATDGDLLCIIQEDGVKEETL